MLTTRQRLIQAAAQGFADHGIQAASLVEITRQAGQRNRGAVHYHFRSREGLLAAVLNEHAEFMALRQGELLVRAMEQPDDDVASVIEVIVRTCVEVAESSVSGRNYLKIIAEISEQDPATYTPEVEAALVRSGGYQVYAVLMERALNAVDGLDEEVRDHRILQMTSFVLGSIARRIRGIDSAGSPGARPQLDTPRFVEDLIAMSSAMLLVPVPGVPASM
ncbi:hypothetical protein NPS01_00650 [Nocardioides psychrotolerans]|uniref:Transcriptional regulator, TetR family n=1 Tax=Nocardioides psychrotolerans TaxID=1005945 RepID=A0A1I3BX06_9ACTN|nr:TetR family transcriptional regulator [Nocardioides psychrotolerans]GEP36402.1 hypothetical protein NPS01_00650 [Nocardioides psychrotolerans]SFH66845.1 transcriptional regulator, TetR family [Nocardioides psychrotolerans]